MLFDQQFNKENAEQLPALTLAWVGDAVYELYVRRLVLKKSKIAKTLSKAAVALVNHNVQSQLLSKIEVGLTEKESQVVRRGRNSHGSIPKNGNVQAYRRATGLEALIGYLYLSGQNERLDMILTQIEDITEEARI